ncbi:poly(hydroxyalkanoate) granule-associated protein [Rhizobium sophorae]|uniref:Poly(Hydroxyalkanoate) granule-associated protein n=1 Tax=Rhizobium sophorae TaxID=1535242 RepID=A0A7Y3WH91_9HYPH|nr:poly(hydroxyalkanoate) granule-associated protein [Rhizobium sophorae]MBX4862991.1 poly(hydroxyalkanoate) granule-associated protein [Rhizobium bangladeshense]NKK69333.1 poly(hydroxyalkanoate) granule-associated protein [Rhizobium leguminosarum bv. viciae]NNU40510.1 poly(hydroxyalkanoate) granule-associated protein [Rhizobium sophorae]
MIRYATSAASNPEPIKAREVSAAKPAIEMPPPKPVIDVAATAPRAGLLLPSSEADELGSDPQPKTTKPARRAATKRKSKVVEAHDTSLQLSLEA